MNKINHFPFFFFSHTPTYFIHMGNEKAVKDFIRARWKGCIQNARSLEEAEKANQDPTYGAVSVPFKHPTMVCFDYTAALKYYPPDRVANGHQYIFNWFLPPISDAFNNGASVVYVCFDRGSPANKDLEHKKRYKNSDFMPIDIINDGIIPSAEHWNGFVNNKQLVGELIYYITQKLLDPQPNPESALTSPPGKMLVLRGARHTRPNREVFHVLLPHPEVLYVKNELIEERSTTGIVNLIPKRIVGSIGDYEKPHIYCQSVRG